MMPYACIHIATYNHHRTTHANTAAGLGILELIHCIVETLDGYFQNVCELDIMCVACAAPCGSVC